jgi:hypothetical protein
MNEPSGPRIRVTIEDGDPAAHQKP